MPDRPGAGGLGHPRDRQIRRAPQHADDTPVHPPEWTRPGGQDRPRDGRDPCLASENDGGDAGMTDETGQQRAAERQWRWPIDAAEYNRDPVLSPVEQVELEVMTRCHRGRLLPQWLHRPAPALARPPIRLLAALRQDHPDKARQVLRGCRLLPAQPADDRRAHRPGRGQERGGGRRRAVAILRKEG